MAIVRRTPWLMRARSSLSTSALATLVTFAPSAGNAQSAESWSLPWTADSGRLVVDVPYATLRVSAHAMDSVYVRIEWRKAMREGMLAPRVSGRDIRLDAPANAVAVDITVHVPPRMALAARLSNGGPILVGGVAGALTLENSNAGIFIAGARNTVLAATSNGPIVAGFAATPADGTLSFLTSNDSIAVTLPSLENAELNLGTDNGRVLVEFPLPERGVDGRPVRAGEAVLRVSIGRGGPVVRARTDNGSIVVRQAERAPDP